MIPSGDPTENAFQTMLGLLEDGDIIVDGGNSNFRDSQRRAAEAAKKHVAFLDAGVSGGIWGLKEGYCVMVGGDADAFGQVEPFLKDLTEEGGYAHVGPVGRRPLREDGPQRDRVRDDAVARRGLRDHEAPRSSRSTSTRSRRSGSTAPSCAAGCSTCSCSR